MRQRHYRLAAILLVLACIGVAGCGQPPYRIEFDCKPAINGNEAHPGGQLLTVHIVPLTREQYSMSEQLDDSTISAREWFANSENYKPDGAEPKTMATILAGGQRGERVVIPKPKDWVNEIEGFIIFAHFDVEKSEEGNATPSQGTRFRDTIEIRPATKLSGTLRIRVGKTRMWCNHPGMKHPKRPK